MHFWLTTTWSWFQSTGGDNCSIKCGEGCQWRHEQYASTRCFTGRIFCWSCKTSGAFWLTEPTTSSHRHTIIPADSRFTGMRSPADSGSHTSTPPPPPRPSKHKIHFICLHLRKHFKSVGGEVSVYIRNVQRWHCPLSQPWIHTSQGKFQDINNISAQAGEAKLHAFRSKSNWYNIGHMVRWACP